MQRARGRRAGTRSARRRASRRSRSRAGRAPRRGRCGRVPRSRTRAACPIAAPRRCRPPSAPTGVAACVRFGRSSRKSRRRPCTASSSASRRFTSSPRPATSASNDVASSPFPFAMPICFDEGIAALLQLLRAHLDVLALRLERLEARRCRASRRAGEAGGNGGEIGTEKVDVEHFSILADSLDPDFAGALAGAAPEKPRPRKGGSAGRCRARCLALFPRWSVFSVERSKSCKQMAYGCRCL